MLPFREDDLVDQTYIELQQQQSGFSHLSLRSHAPCVVPHHT